MGAHEHYKALGADAKAWVFTEARALLARLEGAHPQGVGCGDAGDEVIFETGYGPSGLPHIGTFGEVVRTSMVRQAFELLSGCSTRLICFSDDMDGLRKVPDNVPNRALLEKHLGKPLTQVPDPFEQYESFGAHNNARLRAFLDGFGFDYEFLSASDCYRSGRFDGGLKKVLENYDRIMKVMLPSLGAERQATYSPFLPVCPKTGAVLQVAITHTDAEAGQIFYDDPNTGEAMTTGITGGQVKLQWKCDWAMRWYALGVDYEMSGKDLSESVKLSSKITTILGGVPPAGFSYELFLDQNGEKISKSRGNGLSVEEWLNYGTAESLKLFMFHQPRRAKRLYFDVVPKLVDDYFSHLKAFGDQDAAAQLENPVWHIHEGTPPEIDMPISFALLLNLASVCQADKPAIIWGYLAGYAPDVSADSHPELAKLVDYAVVYYRERIAPTKTYRAPSVAESKLLVALADALAGLDADAAAEEIQSLVFAIGKEAGYAPLRDWFLCLYEVLLGQAEGPRMGSFIRLYGIAASADLLRRAASGALAR